MLHLNIGNPILALKKSIRHEQTPFMADSNMQLAATTLVSKRNEPDHPKLDSFDH
jgi:hypothetical protein